VGGRALRHGALSKIPIARARAARSFDIPPRLPRRASDVARRYDARVDVEPSSSSARLFVGLTLPADARAALAAGVGALGAALPKGARVVPAERFHVTVRFLGATERSAISDLSGALGVALRGAHAPRFDGAHLIGLPQPRRARVVAYELAGGDLELGSVARRVDDALAPLGFARETRALRAHVTVARFRQRTDLGTLVGRAARLAPFVADELVLFESELGPHGPTYSPRASYRLDAP